MTSHPDSRIPPEAAAEENAPVVCVRVARSGGVAGLTRRWQVLAPPRDPARWLALVAQCPWEAAAAAADTAANGADRFTWTIEAELDGGTRRAVVGEEQARGPWRTMIDAVRAEASSAL